MNGQQFIQRARLSGRFPSTGMEQGGEARRDSSVHPSHREGGGVSGFRWLYGSWSCPSLVLGQEDAMP